MSTTRTTLQRKLARINRGLAPEDTTPGQAEFTGQLRGDPTYAGRWAELEAELNDLALQVIAEAAR